VVNRKEEKFSKLILQYLKNNKILNFTTEIFIITALTKSFLKAFGSVKQMRALKKIVGIDIRKQFLFRIFLPVAPF